MPLQTETIFGFALLAAGLTIALFGLRHVWRAGKVVRAPRVGEPEAAGATVVRFDGTIEGPAASRGPILAPFSGIESVVVRHVVEERQINPGVWILSWYVTIAEGVESVPFEVGTDDAAVTVDGTIGSAILGSETIESVGAGERLPDHVATFHEETGLSTQPLIFGSLPGPLARVGRLVGLGRRKYSEERLEAGDSVTIVGHPTEGSPETGGEVTVDPLIVSDRSSRRTFLSMAKTGLAAGVLAVPMIVLGVVVLVA